MIALLFSNSFGIFILPSWNEQMQALWYLFLFISWQLWGFLALIWSSKQCCEDTVCQNRKNYAVYDCWKWKLFVGVFFDNMVIQTISLPKTTERNSILQSWKTQSENSFTTKDCGLHKWGFTGLRKNCRDFKSNTTFFEQFCCLSIHPKR